MIKNIIFDFGAVLVDWNPHYLYDPYFGDVAKTDWFLANVCTKEWNHQMDAGLPFSEGIAQLVSRFPEWREAIEMFHSRWGEMLSGPLPGMLEFVRETRDAGYGIYGVTNWSDETLRYIDYVVKEMDGLVVSGQEKVAKPDPELFRRLLVKYELKAEECLFIDDNQANVDAAASLGIRSYRFLNPEQLRKDIHCIML